MYQCLMILFVLLSNTHPQVPVRFNEVVAIIVSIIRHDVRELNMSTDLADGKD